MFKLKSKVADSLAFKYANEASIIMEQLSKKSEELTSKETVYKRVTQVAGQDEKQHANRCDFLKIQEKKAKESVSLQEQALKDLHKHILLEIGVMKTQLEELREKFIQNTVPLLIEPESDTLRGGNEYVTLCDKLISKVTAFIDSKEFGDMDGTIDYQGIKLTMMKYNIKRNFDFLVELQNECSKEIKKVHHIKSNNGLHYFFSFLAILTGILAPLGIANLVNKKEKGAFLFFNNNEKLNKLYKVTTNPEQDPTTQGEHNPEEPSLLPDTPFS